MNKPHQTARAECTHTEVRHDTTLFNPKDIAVQMHHIFKKEECTSQERVGPWSRPLLNGSVEYLTSFLQKLQWFVSWTRCNISAQTDTGNVAITDRTDPSTKRTQHLYHDNKHGTRITNQRRYVGISFIG
jgi:hypothetical protein